MSASARINVLVYSGHGAGENSIKHCLLSLRRLLSPNYSVATINAESLLQEPWPPSCALIVFPGGADLGYCKTLNGAGNRRIRQYVQNGGKYIGFCAGGYYGSKRCEFEVGDPKLEVIGDRELAFFPDVARGCAFAGFQYTGEGSTRAAELRVHRHNFKSSTHRLPETLRTYFNGGSCFVNAELYEQQGVEILASYNEPLAVKSGKEKAAIIHCTVGHGAALLTGPHPEFAAANLDRNAKGLKHEVFDGIAADDGLRNTFLEACLSKMGLKVNTQPQEAPQITPIHVSCRDQSIMTSVLKRIREQTAMVDDHIELDGQSDTFIISTDSPASTLASSLEKVQLHDKEDAGKPMDNIPKELIFHTDTLPSSKLTPYFNHEMYFQCLAEFSVRSETRRLGEYLMYGEVITSTSTILEKNINLTSSLPHGTIMTATTQVSGRGRGSNAWVSPAGSLMFSTVLRHPLSLNVTAPVVFVQYVAALAVAEGIRSYDREDLLAGRPNRYRDFPVRLKWPNDIYVLDPANPSNDPLNASPGTTYTKIGGILVNSSYAGGDYTLVLGIGINVANNAPTTSINAVVNAINQRRRATGLASNMEQELAPVTLESLLARILSCFSMLYDQFCSHGFSRSPYAGADSLEDIYYKHWLHKDAVVTIESEGGTRARIRGITKDFGLLMAEELKEGSSIGTGRTIALQSDSNSFDFFKGLIKRKL